MLQFLGQTISADKLQFAGKLGDIATFFAYPADIVMVIHQVCITNAIESLDSVIRHAIKKHQVFLTDN